ncbi:MAG: 2-deoxy-5-keto-D-gluconate 6-phosphate aldolase domain-containing protein [Ktedonobacteraceae bacterium]
MITGYTKPLYILPFDHRTSYISGLFGWKEPLNVEQMVTVANSKQVIYAGFQQAIADQVPKDHVGILVDEEFGSAILRDAASKGYITATSVEKSGQEEFEFAYGEDFAQHIEAFDPTFAKVLVRYNPEGDVALNQRQAGRLKRMSDYLHRTQRLFMFELLVPATTVQLEQVEGDKNAYDLQLRPRLMLQAMQALQDAGVEPDVWKVEGLDRQEDAVKVVEVARRGGRNTVGLIVLGRGAERDRVVRWLKTAARVLGFIGFAVGRTSFWQPLLDVEAKRISQEEAVAHIAHNFESWIRLFEEARSP